MTALQIADSWPKIPAGTLGTVESYGAGECLAWDDREEVIAVIEPHAQW